MKEVYEIVKADELQIGDIVTIEPDLDPWVMDDVRLTESHLFYRGGGQGTEFSMPRDRKIFRRLPPERNPDVLERALRNELVNVASELGYDITDLDAMVSEAIENARKELESEAGR
jgi:hypothetical protein